jgi:signal transduction histidine kinase
MHPGIRVRTTAAATLAVAVFLALAAIAFALVQRHQLEGQLTASARQEAYDVAAQLAREGASANVAAGSGDQSLVQVVAANGSVLTSSPSVEGEPPVVSIAPAPGETAMVRSQTLPIGEGDDFVVVARGALTPDGPVVVLVAQSLELVAQSTGVVVNLLAIGYPGVLAGVALTAYWLAGRALAPVESIRVRVAEIQGTSTLSARVPEPPGNDEITRLSVTMNEMLERLQAASDGQQRFIGDASHELRSPLATIRAVHEVAALHPGERDWESTTTHVLAELDRVDRLVDDMVLLARADEHGLRLRTADVDVDDLLRDEARRLRLLGRVEVATDLPPARVQGDRDHLARALRNLDDNAARHAQSRVELRVRILAGNVVIEIEDDGPGVPAAERERVFDRFVRLDESRARVSGGAGLGLAIAREIAQAHGGGLRVESGRVGARFVLTLPQVQPADR